jgi:hypothetical protein
MIRLHFTVEGQTEEAFVKHLLMPHLATKGVFADVRKTLTSEDRRNAIEYRGGFRRGDAYPTVKRDILRWMQEDDHPECRYTTMFDLYALPESFPAPRSIPFEPYQKVAALEGAFKADIDASFHDKGRFIPYIQLHEFESLIFADPQALDWEYLEHNEAISNLVAVRRIKGNPEEIDEGPTTAPSKRILREIPEYHKNVAGINVVRHIGLEKLLQECRHFRQWLEKLENLACER